MCSNEVANNIEVLELSRAFSKDRVSHRTLSNTLEASRTHIALAVACYNHEPSFNWNPHNRLLVGLSHRSAEDLSEKCGKMA